MGIAVLMIGTWLLSLVLRTVSIVDIVWGAGFVVVVAWISFVLGDGVEEPHLRLVTLTTLGGLRLSISLLWRNVGKGEDHRCPSMGRHQGPTFPVHSLLAVVGPRTPSTSTAPRPPIPRPPKM